MTMKEAIKTTIATIGILAGVAAALFMVWVYLWACYYAGMTM